MQSKLKHALENYWGIIILVCWLVASFVFNIVRLDPYGIDEQAARGLLLNWSVSDNLVNPIVVFGVPDLRALIFAPIGIYWPGSMLAAKILSVFIGFFMATALYRWIKNTDGKEAALLGTVIFCLSPAVIHDIDSIGRGTFLILGFVLGAWLDRAYRNNNKVFGGWYFTQLLVVFVTVSLHPIAIAYPLAIAWGWHRNPHAEKKSLHVYVGLAIAILVALAITRGWHELHWLSNPGISVSQAMSGLSTNPEALNKLGGGLFILFLITVFALDVKNAINDTLGRILIIALLGGLVIADFTWATVAFCYAICRGAPLLIRINESFGKNTFLSQRGMVVGVAFVTTTFFMLQIKAHSYENRLHLLSPVDELIETLATIASDKNKPFRGASQWPGRTMLACKRDVLPLPPVTGDPQMFLKNLKGLTHLIFDPFAAENKPLSNSIAELGGRTETISLKKAGVIVEVRDSNVKLKNHRPPPSKSDESPSNESKRTDANSN